MHVFNKVHEDSEDRSLGILKPPTNGCREGTGYLRFVLELRTSVSQSRSTPSVIY